MMSIVRRIAADLIGIVLCLGAVFKLLDPVGTTLIVQAYFKFAGLDAGFDLCSILGEILALTESFLGIALITGAFRYLTAIATSALLFFFTVVTSILLVKNPDMDCGCFGEFIHLTHEQSFWKNIILDALAILAFVPPRCLKLLPPPRHFAFGAGCMTLLVFAFISWVQIPMIEFSQYRTSQTIIDVTAPEASQGDDEYPFLPLTDADGVDRSSDILQGNVVVVSCYDPDDLDIASTATFCQDALNAGYFPYVVSRAMVDVPGVECLLADYKAVITLNRSNGGATFLSDGLILRKRSAVSPLDYEEMEQMASDDPTEVYVRSATRHSVALQGFILIFFFILLIL